jgi:hypothetical protein
MRSIDRSWQHREKSRATSGCGEGGRTGLARLPGAKLFAEFLALVQVANQRVGEERLGIAVIRDFELIVATRHVLDQVFHPEQGMAPISHLGVFLHLNVEQGLNLKCWNSHTGFSPEAVRPCSFSLGLG